MSLLTRDRTVPINTTVVDQADFLQPDLFNRRTGIVYTDLVCRLFFNNALQPWAFQSGVGVLDALVSSGRVYFNEIPGSPGFYSVRFRPDAVGAWRLNLAYGVGQQVVALGYQVVAGCEGPTPDLSVSFIPPGC